MVLQHENTVRIDRALTQQRHGGRPEMFSDRLLAFTHLESGSALKPTPVVSQWKVELNPSQGQFRTFSLIHIFGIKN